MGLTRPSIWTSHNFLYMLCVDARCKNTCVA